MKKLVFGFLVLGSISAFSSQTLDLKSVDLIRLEKGSTITLKSDFTILAHEHD